MNGTEGEVLTGWKVRVRYTNHDPLICRSVPLLELQEDEEADERPNRFIIERARVWNGLCGSIRGVASS